MTADDVNWIVNDLGELGVEVAGRCFFLYKGDSFEYGVHTETEDGVCLHTDGRPMRYRRVGKCEFGETCHPITCMTVERGQIYDRTPYPYTQELPYVPGLSSSRPEDRDWKPLLSPNFEKPPEKAKMDKPLKWSFPFLALGQECICPDGYGRVTKWDTSSAGVEAVSVATHVNNRECSWGSEHIILLPPDGSDRPLIRADQLLDANRLKPFMEVALE